MTHRSARIQTSLYMCTMATAAALFALAFSAGSPQASKLTIGGHTLETFTIEVNGETWFKAGNVTVTAGNKTYSTHDGSLAASGQPHTSSGSDAYGSFKSMSQSFSAGGTPFVASYRLYSAGTFGPFVVFEQSWPSGATGTSITQGDISSCWPSIDPTPASGDTLGYVSWQGRFLEASRGGTWQGGNGQGDPGVGKGGPAGPFVVFGEDMTDSLVFSPSSNFMTNTVGMSNAAGDKSFCTGLDAPVTSVPAGYSLETMVFLGTGVNSAMKAFGSTLLARYQTKRPVDYATKWLGFSTDNGAYYYYGWHTTPNITNYQEALEGVHAYAVEQDIPYKHILLDSWWYTKGTAGGLKEWDATNTTFPDGLAEFATKTGWKFQMHNRMWSNNNVYAKQNGGNYNFLVEPSSATAPRDSAPGWAEPNAGVVGPEGLLELERRLSASATPGHSGLSIPDDQSLWNDLMSNKTTRGVPLVVYEQDWMFNEWEGLLATRQSPTLSREWLMQMGAGAAKSNVTVQYCMTYARMVLQTVEIPAVTQFRASDDYGPGQTGFYPTQRPGQKPTDGSTGCSFPYCVYYVGTTSILAHALNLGPSKDNFWSKPLQPGSAFNRNGDPWHPSTLNATHEPYNEMQCAISSFTTGPVTPSDGIGFSNASLIKMSCRSDGRLLHPTAPARAIDASFALSGAPVSHVANVHPVMATHSLVGGVMWSHVLVIGLLEPFKLTPAHLGGDYGGQPSVVWWGYQPSDTVGTRPPNVTLAAKPFSADAPIELRACNYSDFGLYHTAPIFPKSGASFLGEIGKWVPVSEDRVASVTDSAGGLTVGVVGAPLEKVELAFAKGGAVSSTLCAVGADGTATASFDGKAASCK